MLSDLRFGLRGLLKNFGFTTIATFTIALGIGACTAIFSVVNAVLLRPLPYTDAGRLVIVWGELRARHVNDWLFSPPDFRDLRLDSTDVFEDFAGVSPSFRVGIADNGGDAEQVRGVTATPNIFRLLGAHVSLGRDFVEDDAQPPPPPPAGGGAGGAAGAPAPARPLAMAIISHGLWTRRYGGSPDIIGRTIDFGANRAQIVGVLPPDFALLFPPRVNFTAVPDIWTAARINYETANRNNVVFNVIGRLKRGVSYEQAQAQVDRVAADLRAHFPVAGSAGLYFHAIPMHEDIVGGVRPAILSLMGAVAFVLLIACANVANLLIVRASARGRELAVRAAVGASRWQLVQQMLAESLIIAAGGTAAGIVLARAGIRLLALLAPRDLPRLDRVAIDPIVIAFAALAGLLTAVACGMIPALRASRADVMDVLRQTGGRSGGLRRARGMRGAMVMLEVSLSFVLLIGAGLMLRSFIALGHVKPGFDPDHVLTFFLAPPFAQPAERLSFMRQMRDRLRALPRVRDASAATPLPLDGIVVNGRWGTEAALADPATFRQATFHVVLPGYFETMHTRLIEGRTFDDGDNDINPQSGAPKRIIIDELVKARAFPHESAVGKRLLARITTPEAEWFDVIGVVEHERHASLATEGPEAIFFTDAYLGGGFAGRWVVRTSGDPVQLAAAVRSAALAVSPRAALADVQPMQALVDRAMAPIRFTMTMIGVFAVVAVALAAIGLYGVLATLVRQRTAEIGMRMVFGCSRAGILRLVVGEGLKMSAVGMIAGITMSLAITRITASIVVGVSPNDPLTFVAITTLFVLVALVAATVPALRAARLDPVAALRDE